MIYTAPTGPRALLRKIQQIMPQKRSAKERLQQIVVEIARYMVAEVCSIYILEANGSLKLVATEGLKPEAVGKAVLSVGEGIVGMIAQTASSIAAPDAKRHPNFKLLPEVGEEPYTSMLGVPILRRGETLGVLVAQNQIRQEYRDEDVEALEIIALIISDLLANDIIPDDSLPQRADPLFSSYQEIKGKNIASGIALGHVVLHQPRIQVTRRIAEDIDFEIERLMSAVNNMREDIDAILQKTKKSMEGESAEILESVRMFAYDRGWVNRMQDAVKSGLTAESAIEQVYSDARARLLRQPNQIMAERLHDIEDLANRMLRHLTGAISDPMFRDMPENPILVARTLAPTELLDYVAHDLRGLAIETGSFGSHISIVARTLELATVCQAASLADKANDGDAIIVDGYQGVIHLRPPEQLIQSYAEKVRLDAGKRRRYREHALEPNVSIDGQSVKIMANAGLLVDLNHMNETGAEGIGLFRTEFQYMLAPSMPRLEEMVSSYATIMDLMGNKPIYFRTLDVGGDKQLTYVHFPEEENPALGVRAIRYALDNPVIFRQQLRALLRASDGRKLHIMFPMIGSVAEFKLAREVLMRELAWIEKVGYAVPEVLCGTMLEVPSLLFEIDALAKEADFISIGPNDLMQFFFAADRGNAKLEGRFDILSPAPLRAIKSIIDAADRHDTPLSICGEASTDPESLLAFLALGLRAISLPLPSIGPAQWIIRYCDISRAEQIVLKAIDISANLSEAENLRSELSALLPKDL